MSFLSPLKWSLLFDFDMSFLSNGVFYVTQSISIKTFPCMAKMQLLHEAINKRFILLTNKTLWAPLLLFSSWLKNIECQMNRRRSSSLLPSLLIYRDPCPTLKESVLQDRDHAVKSQRLPLSEAPLQDQNGLKSNSLFGLRKFRSDSTHSDSCLSMGRHTTSDDLKENQRVNTPSTFFRHLFDKLKLGHRVRSSSRSVPALNVDVVSRWSSGAYRWSRKKAERIERPALSLIGKECIDWTRRRVWPLLVGLRILCIDHAGADIDLERVQDVDLDFRNNHLYCVDYVHDIFQHVLDIEVGFFSWIGRYKDLCVEWIRNEGSLPQSTCRNKEKSLAKWEPCSFS